MARATLYVRVQQKTPVASFFRCGTKFSRIWLKVEVDEATVGRLHAEQYLEVVSDTPADYVAPDVPDAVAASAPAAPAAAAAPTDPAVRLVAIKEAIAALDKTDTSLWLVSGLPKVEAIAALTGWLVSADERNTAWAEVGKV